MHNEYAHHEVDWPKIEGLYNEAQTSFSQMQYKLQEATRLSVAGRDFFYEWSPDSGIDKQRYIFDNTAKEAAWDFVNSLEELLFPEQFVTFEVGENVPAKLRPQMALELERLTAEYHQLLGQTSFKTAISESLSDVAVSTGFIEIHENRTGYNLQNPISFKCSPMCKTYFTEVNGLIVNTWRENNEYFGSLKTRYSFVDWSHSNYKEGDLVTVMDCCVYQPRNELDFEPFVYYIAESKGSAVGSVLYCERRSYPTRFGFGTDKFPIGTYREGQILKILPTIRMANGIAEMNWISIQYNSMPIMMYDPTRFENPALVRIVPGAQLKINNLSENPLGMQSPPAAPIPFQLNADASERKLESLQSRIETALFSVGAPDTPVRSATEISIQEGARQKGLGRICRRLRPELVDQLVMYSVKAFRRMGYLVRDDPTKSFILNGGDITLTYNNIFTNADYLETVNNINTYRESLQPWVGPELAMQSVDLAKLPEALAKRLNLPAGLVKTPEEIAAIIATAQQASQEANQQAQTTNITQLSQAQAQAHQPVLPSPTGPLSGVA